MYIKNTHNLVRNMMHPNPLSSRVNSPKTYYVHAEEKNYRKIEAKNVSMYKRLIERHNPT